jgi:hypothetical protein
MSLANVVDRLFLSNHDSFSPLPISPPFPAPISLIPLIADTRRHPMEHWGHETSDIQLFSIRQKPMQLLLLRAVCIINSMIVMVLMSGINGRSRSASH